MEGRGRRGFQQPGNILGRRLEGRTGAAQIFMKEPVGPEEAGGRNEDGDDDDGFFHLQNSSLTVSYKIF